MGEQAGPPAIQEPREPDTLEQAIEKMMDVEEPTMQTHDKEGSTESNSNAKRKMPTDMPITDMPITDEEEARKDKQVQESYKNHHPDSVGRELGRIIGESEKEARAEEGCEENQSTTTEEEEAETGPKVGNRETKKAARNQKKPTAAKRQPPARRKARKKHKKNAEETPPTEPCKNSSKRKRIEGEETEAENHANQDQAEKTKGNIEEQQKHPRRRYTAWGNIGITEYNPTTM